MSDDKIPADPLAQAAVNTWNTRQGDVVMSSADITAAGGALLGEGPPSTGSILAVPPTYESLLVTCEYNPAPWNGVGPGLAWAILHDNPVMAWLVDAGAVAPPKPVIIGSMPGAPPATAPVLSPVWASITKGDIYVPDMWRGSVHEFFTLIASNNSAQRKVYAKFAEDTLASAWANWAASNPTLALSEPPNV